MGRAGKREEEAVAVDWVSVMAGGVLTAGLGVAAKALGFWHDAGVSEREMQGRVAMIKQEMEANSKMMLKEDASFNQDLHEAIDELKGVTLTLARLSAGQDQINIFTAKTLEGLSAKAESQERAIADLRATQSLIREVLDRMGPAHRP